MLKGVKPLTYFMEGVGDEPEVCIRRFGELLGYQDWQMDYWLAHRPSLRSNVSVHQDSDGRINHRFDHVDIDRIQ